MNSTEYPGHLNPFGDEEDDEANATTIQDEYPDYLDPFGDADTKQNKSTHLKSDTKPDNDYDDSLNPFGDEANDKEKQESIDPQNRSDSKVILVDNRKDLNEGNPFGDETDHEQKLSKSYKSEVEDEQNTNNETNTTNKNSSSPSPSPQPQSLESLEPPKPLPRTKSLLKKELALKRRQLEQPNNRLALKVTTDSNHRSENLSSDNFTSNKKSTSNGLVGSFQRNKNKRVAPPVPVNFKRQVSGSLDAIEEELNDIGDQLACIEKETNLCQELLKAPNTAEQANFQTTKTKLIELIKSKNLTIRRQKELMYKKRELKLDQIHSDIEYELRMIGNKQLSTRTTDDEAKEKELLKKLVEIVEEKSDIVENLNKDTSSDIRDIEEAFKRLNLVEHLPEKLDEKSSKTSATIKTPLPISGIAPKKENCDKIVLNKFSKIATLLPKSNAIKSTMKIKRKHLFKRDHDSQSPAKRQTET